MSIAVVILNWNGRAFLEQFLGNVTQSCQSIATVAVIDNASTDDSAAYVKQHHPEVQWIPLDKNYGFAQGYNEGLKSVDSDLWVLLNSDVQVESGWLEPLIRLMNEHKNVAACQPKIRSFAQPHLFEYAGAAGGFIDRHYYPFCRGRVYTEVEEDHNQYNQTIEVAWATGACMMVRAHLFRELGGFDPDFFAHMEEIDLCLRLKNRGYSVAYCPESVVYHVGGGTLQTGSPFKTLLNFRNNLALIVKNHHSSPLIPKVLVRMVLDGVKGLEALLKGRFSETGAILRAHGQFYHRLPKLLKQRRNEQKARMEPNENGLYKGSLLWNFIVLKNRQFSQFKPGVPIKDL